MTTSDELIDWCEQQRETLEYKLQMMRSGVLKTVHRSGPGMPAADTTPESIARAERQLAMLDRVVARRLAKP